MNKLRQQRVAVGVLALLITASAGWGYDVRDYEEDAGISILGFRAPNGDVYGGGFESGVWLRNAPVFGELFGHWLSNKLQAGNYYSIGMTIRLMPRSAFAPFIGGGGSYNGLTSERRPSTTSFRAADKRYWAGHAEVGFRWWYGPRHSHFFEAGYRAHWTETGSAFNYEWGFIEFGQMF